MNYFGQVRGKVRQIIKAGEQAYSVNTLEIMLDRWEERLDK